MDLVKSIIVIFLTLMSCTSSDYKLATIEKPELLFKKDYILHQIQKTADWQLANLPEQSWYSSRNRWVPIESNGWIRSAFFTGISATFQVTQAQRYLDVMNDWGALNDWQIASRPRHADDHCCVQTYVDLFLIDKDSSKISPSIKAFEPIIAEPMLGSEVGWEKEKNWNWCDALFMAPPALARLAVATGDTSYLKLMDLMYWDTYEYLFDKNENLFYRDDRFKADAEPLLLSDNGTPIFWSRGNGWVFAGLARILAFLPDSYESKAKYKDLFERMAAKLIILQDEKGFWHSNLMDPVSSPEPESSGTAFFCYGLAWGINNEYLNKETYLSQIKKAWLALNRCLDSNGQLHWVQTVGAAPASVKFEDSVEYATGAFLLAASEVYKLVD